jgi:hypothetical protein
MWGNADWGLRIEHGWVLREQPGGIRLAPFDPQSAIINPK